VEESEEHVRGKEEKEEGEEIPTVVGACGSKLPPASSRVGRNRRCVLMGNQREMG
jgi:hypothetical protein